MEENIQTQIPKRNVPRDLFLHLLVIVTLYWSSISFVTLVWQFINRWFPDALNSYSYLGDYSTSLIRFSVSAILVVFPVFIIVSWYLNKIYRRESAVRESKIRKWLIYLTLFITSLVIIGDLIFTVNTFLGGEVTVRFILKASSIILVAGIIFGYYLDDVRRETPTSAAKYFAWVTGILVLAVVVYSFVVVGSPSSTRLMQFDQQKISNLQSIQGQVVNYYQRKAALPNILTDLNDPISSYRIPVDSQTKVQYEYIIKDSVNLSFELCANFNKAGVDQYGRTSPVPASIKTEPGTWDHPAGRFCFERTIDKQIYPLLNTVNSPIK
jgi:hypothetical protein